MLLYTKLAPPKAPKRRSRAGELLVFTIDTSSFYLHFLFFDPQAPLFLFGLLHILVR
ncbi:uncharacterized protein LY79DRAFT_543979 [Colletotrichum navitas]|uniref:Uncharacterized protein n=1 Tax=Colletotrichum navitas TaxID=681940 RepID=A0AAD8Q6B2_9PEZI|nr:uncharacterized protein LY79DRAFT_543979 [Colletotrichum navitas]KAK1596716.1 hypothetical protein LY79DRAFT_543979 [Colletotrichum navitas]